MPRLFEGIMFVRQRLVYELVKDLNGSRCFVLAGVCIDLDILDQRQSHFTGKCLCPCIGLHSADILIHITLVLIFGIGTLAKFLIFSGQVILFLLIFTEESGTYLVGDKPCDLVLIHAPDQAVKLFDAVINIPKSFLCRIVTLCLIALLVGEELLTNVRLIQHQVDLSLNIRKHNAFKKRLPDRMRGAVAFSVF